MSPMPWACKKAASSSVTRSFDHHEPTDGARGKLFRNGEMLVVQDLADR